MSTVKRNVGEPMRLRLSLGDNATTKFVRAQLFFDGVSFALVPVPHQADGIYGNNSYLMPNTPVIDVKYKVYFDAGFDVEDPTYFSATDQYEVDDFDPSQFAPPFPQSVYAQVENGRTEVRVDQVTSIQAVVKTETEVDALVEPPSEVAVDLSQQNEITGVLDD